MIRLKNIGYTLIELLVSLAIGLVLSVVLASMAISFGSSRSSNIASNTANTNATTASGTLEAGLAHAGLGLTGSRSLICSSLYSYTATQTNSALPFWPLNVDATTSTNSNRLSVAYGTGGSAPVLMGTTTGVATLNTDVTVLNSDPVATSDSVLFAYGDVSGACVLRDVTANASATRLLSFNASSIHNGIIASAPTFMNPFYIAPIKSLVFQTWYAENGMLKFQDNLTGAVSIVSDGVMYLRAQYGVGDASNGIAWTDVQPTNYSTLKAVRIALIVRVGDHEKQATPANCTRTTTSVTPLGDWMDSTGTPLTVDVSTLQSSTGGALIPDWKCFYYKAYTSAVPLRSLVWGLTL